MATPTYSELASMVNSSAFLDRCTFAVIKYARYILGNNASSIRQLEWAKQAVQNPVGTAMTLKYAIAWDGIFINQNNLNFDLITDATLQGAVEVTINSTVLVF